MQVPAGVRAALLLAVVRGTFGASMSEDDVTAAEACEGDAARTSLLQAPAAPLLQAPAGGGFLQARAAAVDAQQADLDRRLGRFKESLALSSALRALTYAQARIELLTTLDIGLIFLAVGIVIGVVCVIASKRGKHSET
mmetsp:Transcript_113491/g.308263  ORF Transcript_113491/g.308263 Transcript_113491/m.308263 type:complete len:139 (-) Transcript_113491:87-503(-)